MNAGNGLVVGHEVLVLSGEQLPSLSRLSVFQRRERFLQLSGRTSPAHGDFFVAHCSE